MSLAEVKLFSTEIVSADERMPIYPRYSLEPQANYEAKATNERKDPGIMRSSNERVMRNQPRGTDELMDNQQLRGTDELTEMRHPRLTETLDDKRPIPSSEPVDVLRDYREGIHRFHVEQHRYLEEVQEYMGKYGFHPA
jgi:hypothetical protein